VGAAQSAKATVEQPSVDIDVVTYQLPKTGAKDCWKPFMPDAPGTGRRLFALRLARHRPAGGHRRERSALLPEVLLHVLDGEADAGARSSE